MIAKGRSREEMIKQINSRSWSFIGNMEIRICGKKKGLQETRKGDVAFAVAQKTKWAS